MGSLIGSLLVGLPPSWSLSFSSLSFGSLPAWSLSGGNTTLTAAVVATGMGRRQRITNHDARDKNI